MFAVPDPVEMGFVASLARPGGHVTGITSGIPKGFLSKQLLNHLVGPLQQRGRNRAAERRGGLCVDDQLKLARLFDG